MFHIHIKMYPYDEDKFSELLKILTLVREVCPNQCSFDQAKDKRSHQFLKKIRQNLKM